MVVLLAAALIQTSTVSLADQELTFKFSTVGKFGTPLGYIEDPFLNGNLSLAKSKKLTKDADQFRICLSFKRDQSKLIAEMSESFPEQKYSKETAYGMFREGDTVFLIDSYVFDHKNFECKSVTTGDYSAESEVMNPLAMAFVIAQRSLNQPELRKEYPVMTDGPRKFSVTFRPNFNASTESVPGDVAFKFDLKLKDANGEYPSFFTGAIRLNRTTGKIQYLSATSDPMNQPKNPNVEDIGGPKSYVIRIDAKPSK